MYKNVRLKDQLKYFFRIYPVVLSTNREVCHTAFYSNKIGSVMLFSGYWLVGIIF